MNIKLLFEANSRELRKSLINSKFYYSDFDRFIIGVETNSGSIIYDLEQVLKFMIRTENPLAFEYDDYKDFEYVYNVTFDKLVKTNSQIGMNELEQMVEYNKEYPSENNPYTFCWIEDLIEWVNKEIQPN